MMAPVGPAASLGAIPIRTTRPLTMGTMREMMAPAQLPVVGFEFKFNHVNVIEPYVRSRSTSVQGSAPTVAHAQRLSSSVAATPLDMDAP